MSGNDRDLVRQALRGRRDAFDALVGRHQGVVYATAAGRTGDFEAAADITQSVFLQAFLTMRSLRKPDRFRSWLIGIARNLSSNYQRSKGRMEAVHEAQVVTNHEELPDKTYEQAELRALVRGAVGMLDEKYREAVLLHYMEGLSYEEVSEALDVPRSTVVGRLQTAREQLRDRLGNIAEEALRGEKPAEEMKARVMAGLPAALFVRGSLHSILMLFTGKSLLKWSGYAAAACLGTALYFLSFEHIVGQRVDSDMARSSRVTNGLEMELADNATEEAQSQQGGENQNVAVGGGQEKQAKSGTKKPRIGIIGSATDPEIVIQYTVPESAHVDVWVSSRTGAAMVMPVSGGVSAGTHSVTVNKASWPRSSYRAWVRSDYDRRKQSMKSFIHHEPGATVTESQELTNMLNQAMESTISDPERAVKFWDELLEEHPDYIDRGAVFFFSIGANMRVADSTKVHGLIDSAVTRLPGPDTYEYIARFTNGLEAPPSWNMKLYPSTAVHYAQKALDHIEMVPEPNRNGKRVRYNTVLGHSYLVQGALDQAEKAFGKALAICKQLPSHDNAMRKGYEAMIFKSLGTIDVQREDYAGAMMNFENALPQMSWDTNMWDALQRSYTLARGSDAGWDAYFEKIQKRVPENNRPQVLEQITPLPKFQLKTLDDKTMRSTDLKGKVTVINFWGYWCGPCIEELGMLNEIARDYRNQQVVVLGVHRKVGKQLGFEDDHLGSVKKVAEQVGTTFPMLYDTHKVDLTTRLGVTTVPTTMVVDQSGKIQHLVVGFDDHTSEQNLRKVIDGLVGETSGE